MSRLNLIVGSDDLVIRSSLSFILGLTLITSMGLFLILMKI